MYSRKFYNIFSFFFFFLCQHIYTISTYQHINIAILKNIKKLIAKRQYILSMSGSKIKLKTKINQCLQIEFKFEKQKCKKP